MLERALQLFNEMQQQGLKPNVITYTAGTSAKGQSCSSGIDTAAGYPAHLITFTAMIGQGGTLQLVDEMRRHGFQPHRVTYIAVIGARRKCRTQERALRRHGFQPHVITTLR